ncbi:alpha/beta hydrolase [Sphingomonas sp. AOB5]|uniref:alpha/beta fold hydrolase n=1 Tax=Sphingomonas sp. AOB5 TaxID=3034017 RepID=UPI0023F9FE08|nr:alpha/beta hydrolase [Sphingomonas sp. AOB5]MDF7777009.1 alpha/beta hydrolase [Sphingomonas sp. AOB5]
MKPVLAFTAMVAALLSTTSALAQRSPAGDWQGTMEGSSGPLRAAVHIEQKGAGVFTGDIDLPDNGLWNLPLEDLTLQDGVLRFTYRGRTRRFEGRWDPAAGAWVGQVRTAGRTTDMALRPGFLGLPVIQGLNGYWEGTLVDQGVQATVLLHVVTDEHGTHALIDLPHALEMGVPVNQLNRTGDGVSFAAPALGLRFEGKLQPDGKSLKGSFGLAPAEFSRNDRGPPGRPQLPRAPFPYAIEELSFLNGDVSNACTLTLPHGKGPHPVAYLLTGTGPQDRDETMVGHKPFLVLADHLARNGIAALRCDDRGVGGSSGRFNTSTLEDFADDVDSGLAMLMARPEIDKARVGLIGHSEGGIVASMVASRRKDVAFVVQMAGPGAAVYDLLLKQGEEMARAQGYPEAVIAEQNELRRTIFEAVRAAPTPEAARTAVETILIAKGMPADGAKRMAARSTRPDVMRILNVDPATTLSQVRAPVLAIVGSKDTQVPPTMNLPLLRAALAGNPDATVTELPGLNHLMQTVRTGAVSEYYLTEETIAPLALDTITNWLAKRGFGRKVR